MPNGRWWISLINYLQQETYNGNNIYKYKWNDMYYPKKTKNTNDNNLLKT